jgi:hypothetical protein
VTTDANNSDDVVSEDRRGCDGVSLPLNEECYPDLLPFFFGIDCRPEKERSIGTFPKVTSLK